MANPIPLTAPDGTIRTYACGVCLNIATPGHCLGELDDEAMREDAEHYREDADRCCRCERCSRVYRGQAFGDRCCADCKPEAERARSAQREVWERNEAERQAAREQSLEKAKERDAAVELEALMSDISEECWCASWLIGLEFNLWAFCRGEPGEYGMGRVGHVEIHQLKKLSERADGWWRFEEFVPMDEWLLIYAEHRKTGASE